MNSNSTTIERIGLFLRTGAHLFIVLTLVAAGFALNGMDQALWAYAILVIVTSVLVIAQAVLAKMPEGITGRAIVAVLASIYGIALYQAVLFLIKLSKL